MQDNHPITDQDILNNRTPGTDPDLDVGRRADADADADTNSPAGTQSAEADANTPGQVPVAGNTGDQRGHPSAGNRDSGERDSAAAAGAPATSDQTDTGAGEEYNTAPSTQDPEQELLDPGYDPQLPGGSGQRGTTPPGQPGFAEHPGLGGMPNQQGRQDQTTYHNQG
ncbi:MAG: hypothetical protein ACRDHE_04175 [Ktedonobacterales bacterium]